MRLLQLIAKHHEWGCNILGLSLLLGWVGVFLALANFTPPGFQPLLLVLLVLFAIVIGGIDFVWRYFSEPRSSSWRFVLPSSGGAVAFIPIWLFFAAQPAVWLTFALAIMLRGKN